MKRLTIILLACIVIVSGCNESFFEANLNITKKVTSAKKPPLPVDFFPQPLTLTSIGDSLTKGVGSSKNKGGYLHYLQTDLENLKQVASVQTHNLGFSGNRTDQILLKLRERDIQTKINNADLIIVTIGGNDLLKIFQDNFFNLQIENFLRAMTTYEQNLHAIFTKIRTINEQSTIILVGLYNPFTTWFSDIEELDEIINQWNDTGATVANNYPNSYFLNIAQQFGAKGETVLHDDNFHPNDLGYEIIAQNLYELIESNIIDGIVVNKYRATKKEDN